MTFRARTTVIILAGAVLLTGWNVWTHAQAVAQPTPPVVLSGSDIGFRVEGKKRERRTDTNTGRTYFVDVAVGQPVVRIGGQWIETVEGHGLPRPATN